MFVIDLYSKRKKSREGVVNDVFGYDDIPSPLRIQVGNIIKDRLGESYYGNDKVKEAYNFIVTSLRNEYGVKKIADTGYNGTTHDELFKFLEFESDVDKVLDAIELSFRIIETYSIDYYYKRENNAKELAHDAIKALNIRFREHAIGFAYEEGEIIRIDSQYVHDEIVKPAISILSAGIYDGARSYFLNAHEHYRHSKYEECIVECGKAVEAVMKAICDKRGWAVSGNATYGDLVKVCFNNNIIDPIWRGHFDNLEKLIKSGIPPARNIKAAHASTTVAPIPQPIVSYVLHMTASTVVFLADSEKLLP